MCKTCAEIDSKIAHYKRIAIHVTDQQTLDGIAGLLRQMASEKASIRCDQTEKR